VSYDTLIPAMLFLPLIGFLFTAVVGRRLGKRAHLVPVGLIVITAPPASTEPGGSP